MKTIIFDFDGTIANSSLVFMAGWNEFASDYGYAPVKEADIVDARQLTLHQNAKKFNFPMIKLPLILPKIYTYFHRHIHEIQLYEGMRETLEALKKQGFTLVILSSNDKNNIATFLEKEQLQVFDAILTSNILFGKDRILKKYMKEMRQQPTDIFYIGDELRDLEACKKCNIPFGWVSWGLQGEELLDFAGGVAEKFYTPAEIVTKLKK